LDAYLLEHGKPVGPLHGLPISVKEHIHLKGSTATSGLIAWADNVCEDDALIVSQFREAGAVFHVKTTNPQTLMSLETTSNLFGRTLNPHNTSLTSGGSSGGEAALIAMRGSPMGIGTDIGGSIRVPSAFCGIHGFKPSVGRTPHSGLSGLHDGMQNIIGVVGPMTRSLDDVNLFMSVALGNGAFLREPAMIEKPWRGMSSSTQIKRVGVMLHDGMVHPHPPVTRALEEVANALQRSGVDVVDWQPDFHQELLDLANQAYFQDGGKEYYDVLEEGQEPCVHLLARSLSRNAGEISVAQSWKVRMTLPHDSHADYGTDQRTNRQASNALCSEVE
jgi:amidase